jgi:ATP-dependent DNA helicase RecQ
VSALEFLHTLAGPRATFREHQEEAIRDLVDERARVLRVQRTGWGKSAVYFIATALLRRRGGGPALIVSPLLALMRNQIAAAEPLGTRAHTVNSTNREAWDEERDLLAADAVDLLLISPERLNNPRFRDEMLPLFASRVGLLVVDEVHCGIAADRAGHGATAPVFLAMVAIVRSCSATGLISISSTVSSVCTKWPGRRW